MQRNDSGRIDAKRRNVIDARKKQFATPQYKEIDYPHRLNFYTDAPTAEITLEEFEQWAIDRLQVLGEIDSCSMRNKTPAETASYMQPILDKYMPLEANSSASSKLFAQRQKDHYSHFILRFAFSATADLRRRFARNEAMLFRMRFANQDAAERAAFVKSLNLGWCEPVSDAERQALAPELMAFSSNSNKDSTDNDTWLKVDWNRVPDLVEHRRVLLKLGKAFVPSREQSSMVVAEFCSRLDKQLELTARALPRVRVDEENHLMPIFNHLSKYFMDRDSAYMSRNSAPDGAQTSAATIDYLSQHFPACMKHLHMTLRREAHLKNDGRLQYTLFLKGIGLSLEECLIFWRGAFSTMTDDTFNTKGYRYAVRYAYGDVGGEAIRRGHGYTPYSCQKILTEKAPGPGEAHGCPYRHFDLENLTTLLGSMGVTDRAVLHGVKQDKDSQKFHMACNRVFDHLHKAEIKKAKDEGIMTSNQLETIVHPNEYYKRSYLLKNLGIQPDDVKTEE